MQKEKRKWQMAFRRYVLEGAPSEQYAPYFGLCRLALREWISLQFEIDQHWGNFGKVWQFEHVIPVSWFDAESEEELKACWNFLNIKVASTESTGGQSDLLFALNYFQELFKETGFSGCQFYIHKVQTILENQGKNDPSIVGFIQRNHDELEALRGFTHEEYQQYLETSSVKTVLTEREILKKFG